MMGLGDLSPRMLNVDFCSFGFVLFIKIIIFEISQKIIFLLVRIIRKRIK